MNLKQAQKLFDEYVKTEEIRKHCFEVETIMSALAIELKENEEKWAIAGLLHDMDYDIAKNIKEQGKIAVDILKSDTNCDEDICHAILAHNEKTGTKRESKFDYALSAADNISGLIYAYGRVRESLDSMEVSGLRKRFKEKKFAATVRRDLIQDIEKTGLSLDRFMEISIKAMQSIAKEIGF